MAVRFKFRSSVNFDSVPIGEQPSISVRDLKSNVLLAKNLNICHDFDLQFSDAITGQEYVNEDVLIPSGSCVIIKRVPAGTTHKDTVQSGSLEKFRSQPTKIVDSSPPVKADINELDDFGDDFYSVPCDLDIDLRIQRDKRHIGNERFPEPFKADLPSELKCSICDSFIKDAMMIPCCQHSFCEKCILLVLVERGSCPKCYSTKCTVEELLPNVSLRQAIEHFLESQMLMTDSRNAFHQYAPDEESEAHVKDVSYNFSTHQKDIDIPQSPSQTETGSNEIMEETAHNPLLRENASPGCIGSHFSYLGAKSCEKRQMLEEGQAFACPEKVGASGSTLRKGQHINEKVESITKEKRGLRAIAAAAGGKNRSMASRRPRKGNINCYMCGSPDHLIRECPATSNPNPMLKRGIAMIPRSMLDPLLPYWNATSLHHAGPFTNLYGNYAMMPFNTVLSPGGLCTNPTYMPRMYSAMPSFRANSFGNGDDCIKRHLYRQQIESSHYYKSYLTEEKVASTSHDGHPQQRKGKHNYHNLVDNGILSVDNKNSHSLNGSRGQWSCQHPDQTSSEVEDFPCSSCCGGEERKEHQYRPSKRERESNRISDIRRGHYKHDRHLESDPETSFSPDKIRKQKPNTHDFGYPKCRVKSDDDDLSHNRWWMRSGSDDSDEGFYHYCKWKRGN